MKEHARGIDSDYSQYADEVIAKLQELGFRRRNIGRSLRSFLYGLAQMEGPLALGLVYRDEGYHRPIIEVNILWSSFINLVSSSQAHDMDRVVALHARFARCVECHLDTLLYFVDPATCSPVPLFAEAVAKWSRESGTACVIACRKIPQVSSTC